MPCFKRINTNQPEVRLDKFLASTVPLSRTKLRKIIAEGGVEINRKRCRTLSRKLALGDKVQVFINETTEVSFREEQILGETTELIVVDKPSGLPSQPTLDSTRANLFSLLKAFLAKRNGLENTYLGMHHRLDRDTSGVLLFTKKRGANKAIAQAFQNRAVEKEYMAIVEGAFSQKICMHSLLAPHSHQKGKWACIKKRGKVAISEFQGKKTFSYKRETVSLVRIRPKTGRTHQIRVQLAALGHPILGDYLYGAKIQGVSRTMLHAEKLSLLGESWQVSPPKDFPYPTEGKP